MIWLLLLLLIVAMIQLMVLLAILHRIDIFAHGVEQTLAQTIEQEEDNPTDRIFGRIQ